MDRREAIVSLTTVLGYSITPGSIISLSSACSQQHSVNSWNPNFFAEEDSELIVKLSNVMLPKTSTPGATEVGAHLFTDKFLSEVASTADQEKCTRGFSIWKSDFEDSGNMVSKLTEKDIERNLSGYFDIEASKRSTISAMLKKKQPAGSDDSTEYYIYSFLMKFKQLLMLGYYASEEIGESVLTYLPVPGKYEGCIPVENVENSWSL